MAIRSLPDPAAEAVYTIARPRTRRSRTRGRRGRIIDYAVVHRARGRVRLRVEAIRWDAGLADRVESFIADQPGIVFVRTARACACVIVTFDEDTVSVTRIGIWLQESPGYEPRRTSRERTDGNHLGAALAGAAAVVVSTLRLNPGVATALVALSAVPIVVRAVRTLSSARRLSVDGLDATAVAVLLARGSTGAAGLSSSLIAAGEFIRAHTARRSRVALSGLLGTWNAFGWLVEGERRVRVPAQELRAGQTIVVYPGELIPVDGTVIDGRGHVDEKALTGESMPVVKDEGSEVFASTTLVDGKVYVRTTRAGEATRSQRVIQALASAPAQETAAANHAAAFADRLVLPTLVLAVGVYGVTRNVAHAVSVLVFDLATGIRVSAPTTTLAAMTAATRRGVIVKSGAALEKLAHVDTLLFDKTGTLTRGHPEVTSVVSTDVGISADEVLAFAAAAEQRLSHPVAQAVVRAAHQREMAIPARTHSHFTVGLGVRARVRGRVISVGDERYMLHSRIDLPPAARAAIEEASARWESNVIVAADDRVIGVVSYNDLPRAEAKSVIREIRVRSIDRVIMVTGDNERVARSVARQLRIDDVRSGIFPEEKARIVADLQAAGRHVAVIGDGVNDSPALAYADVSISIEGATDVAVETADIVLPGGIGALPECIDLARETVALIEENIRLVAVPNLAGMALATAGLMGPLAATGINNGSTIVAGLNSLRPLRARSARESEHVMKG